MTGLDPDLVGLCLAVAAAVLLAAGWIVDDRWPRLRRMVTTLLVLVAVGSAFSYLRLGQLRGSRGLVHGNEQLHFYAGSKYLAELRYDGLYPAVSYVFAPNLNRTTVKKLRDTRSLKMVPLREQGPARQQIRDRFTPERWAALMSDVRAYRDAGKVKLSTFVTDYGNTGSPSWAAVAFIFTSHLALSLGGMTFLGLLDLVLLAVLCITIWRTFGTRTAALAMILGLVPVRAFAFLGGSILRLDWLFAVAMAFCLLRRRRMAVAGLFLGYAISSKVFCGLIALALGAHMLGHWWRERRVCREDLRLIGGAVLGLLLSVGISSAIFGGVDIWVDYIRRIWSTFGGDYYRGQFSLRTVYLQLLGNPVSVFDPSPRHVHAVEQWHSVHEHPAGFLVVRGLLLAGLACVAARREAMASAFIGVLMIFVVLVTNMYYWQLMLLLAFAASGERASWQPRLWQIAGCAWIAAAAWPEVDGWSRMSTHGYFGSLWMAVFVLGLLLVEGATLLLQWRRGGAAAAPALERQE